MTAIGTPSDDTRILPALAQALVEHPRATLQELARAVGISKATLYRHCRTREQLIERLNRHASDALSEVLRTAGLETEPPLEALRRLIANNLEHREMVSFLMHYWKDAPPESARCDESWDVAMDAFFLRGQQEGVFRIDIPAPALAEVFVGILINLVESERRGRVARAGLGALIERAFLEGALAGRAAPATAPAAG